MIRRNLPHRIELFIPTSRGELLSRWMDRLTSTYGGVTGTESSGVWIDNTGKVHSEPVTIVTVFTAGTTGRHVPMGRGDAGRWGTSGFSVYRREGTVV